ncbi:MAG: DUF1223 domain-containing protein [Thioalkalispiraceae bacterium]|jgi:hypothetical protein
MLQGTLITLLIGLLIGTPSFAAEIRLDSGIWQNRLVELFTSEGCSSCPPAERFLNSLKTHNRLWKNVIPLAFHVDYWDYIGWKDRFAQAAFSQRQRQYARWQQHATVFTPAFFINGENWRRGFLSRQLPEPEPIKVGRLSATLSTQRLVARFQPVQPSPSGYILNIALLGNDITNHIKAGENRGRTSRHEFVVLDHQQHLGNNLEWQVAWSPLTRHVRALSVPGYAVALWVNAVNNPVPLQATGGTLPGNFFKTTAMP